MENCGVTRELLKEFILSRIENDEFRISNNTVEIGDYVIEFKKKIQTIETYDSQGFDNLETPRDLTQNYEQSTGSDLLNTNSESSITIDLNQGSQSKKRVLLFVITKTSETLETPKRTL